MFLPHLRSCSSFSYFLSLLTLQMRLTKMAWTMERIASFSSAHRLHSKALTDEENAKVRDMRVSSSHTFSSQVYGKCNHVNGHGHNYAWKVVLRGGLDQTTGMLYDLALLKKEMDIVLEMVDHRNLDLDVPFFANVSVRNVIYEGIYNFQKPSTSENVVFFLFTTLKSAMSRPDILHQCILHETDKNSFTYQEDS